jgi:hypothetical protein
MSHAESAGAAVSMAISAKHSDKHRMGYSLDVVQSDSE